jgi:uncharacterized protein YxjI
VSLLYETCFIVEDAVGKKVVKIECDLVELVGCLKIEIYPSEHAPPHFHVKSKNINAILVLKIARSLKAKFRQKIMKR